MCDPCDTPWFDEEFDYKLTINDWGIWEDLEDGSTAPFTSKALETAYYG